MMNMFSNITQDFLMTLLLQGGSAAVISTAFAMLFSVPMRYLKYIAMGGCITRVTRTFLYNGMGVEVVLATFLACALTSLVFIYICPKVKVPRPVFTVASIIPVIPGLDAYSCLLALVQVIEDPQMTVVNDAYLVLHHGMRCYAIMLAIALGIAVPPLFFYRYRKGFLR